MVRRSSSHSFVRTIVECVGDPNQIPSAEQSEAPDPRRNLFWMFISFMGISMPRQGQEHRAILLLIAGVVLLLAFVGVGIFALFRLW